MKLILVVALLAGGAYLAWGRLGPSAAPEALFDGPYVVVYGRDTCGLTQGMMSELDRLDVAYDYQQIDDPAVADPLHERMDRAGLSIASYRLPVVDVSGRLMVSPDAVDVATAYRLSTAAEDDGEL